MISRVSSSSRLPTATRASGCQARGSASPEADLLGRSKSRFERAVSLGFKSVLDRFSKDATFAGSLLNEGFGEYDCERYDCERYNLLKSAHLPKHDRTRAQVRFGTSESSQLEHNAMCLAYLDIASEEDAPDRFRYLGQPWLYMFKIEIYAEEEYIEYLERNPAHNLLLSNTGVDAAAVHDAERHLKHTKDQNIDVFIKKIEEKKKQSRRAKEKNEAKRKAEQTAAFGQAPSKKGTSNPVARTTPSAEAASSSTSARAWLDAPQSASGDREYTGKWVKWHGKWHKKVIRCGRTEWESPKPARCSRHYFCRIAAFLLVSLSAI